MNAVGTEWILGYQGWQPPLPPLIFSLQIRVMDLQYNLKGIMLEENSKVAFLEKKDIYKYL